ncbi:transcription factor MYB44-like [Solanum dulcamara]|uniref:transcription factor MYB44-like n=1 Tax=Solanum dulcamara TaxID=45834 RepID=UPI00248684DE|nr:transcription factor MYB44-like [Solanum dulcamara]
MKKTGQIKPRWSPEEDELLQKLVEKHGAGNWSLISQLILSLSAKSCRTDKAIKNHWNSTLKRNRPSMPEDLTFKNPQPPFKRLFSIGADTNLDSSYESDISNLGFSRFAQSCLYSPVVPLGRVLPLSTFSLVMPDPSTSLSPYGSDLNNLGFSRHPQPCLYPPIAPSGRILPLSTISPVMPDPLTSLMPDPSTTLSPYGFDLNNLGSSRFSKLCLYLPSAPPGRILPLSTFSPVMPNSSTSLSLSLSRFRSSENFNRVN